MRQKITIYMKDASVKEAYVKSIDSIDKENIGCIECEGKVVFKDDAFTMTPEYLQKSLCTVPQLEGFVEVNLKPSMRGNAKETKKNSYYKGFVRNTRSNRKVEVEYGYDFGVDDDLGFSITVNRITYQYKDRKRFLRDLARALLGIKPMEE